ncbi:hypothetical protein F8271_30935 [Micromonospora sp. ALFpr18c]|nr:hypothetical protein F8271_30935 [Micromonospora sp. ALFpr18c]
MDEGVFCVRSARTRSGGRGDAANKFVSCNPAPPALLLGDGPPILPAKPVPYVAPLDPQQQKVILVGVVRGNVASVAVTMFGTTVTAAVHPLPAVEGGQVGAYAVWLPRSGPAHNGMSSSDITAVIGYDASGQVVVQLNDA